MAHNRSSATEALEGGVHVTSVAKVTQTSESIVLRKKNGIVREIISEPRSCILKGHYQKADVTKYQAFESIPKQQHNNF